MADDPLVQALETIKSKVDVDMGPLIDALQAGEPVEPAWHALLDEVLGET